MIDAKKIEYKTVISIHTETDIEIIRFDVFSEDNGTFSLSINDKTIIYPSFTNDFFRSKIHCEDEVKTDDLIRYTIVVSRYLTPFKRKIIFEYTEKNGVIILIDDKSLFKFNHLLIMADPLLKFVTGFGKTNEKPFGIEHTTLISKYRFNNYEIHIKPEELKKYANK